MLTAHSEQAAPGVRRLDERATGKGRCITQRRSEPCTVPVPVRDPVRTPAGDEAPSE